MKPAQQDVLCAEAKMLKVPLVLMLIGASVAWHVLQLLVLLLQALMLRLQRVLFSAISRRSAYSGCVGLSPAQPAHTHTHMRTHAHTHAHTPQPQPHRASPPPLSLPTGPPYPGMCVELQ